MPGMLRLALLAVASAGLFALLMLRAHPSVAALRRDILAHTPAGSSMAAVMQQCARDKWECLRSDAAGYLNTDTHATVGMRSVWTGYDEYFIGLRTPSSIAIYWGFDEQGRLLDVWVLRSFDFF